MLRYPLTLTEDDNDTFLVTCPDLPEVVTFGATEADCIANGSAAVSEAIAARLHRFEPIPRPTTPGVIHASVSLHMTMVVELFWTLAARCMTRADLQRALGWHRPQVDRLFDPNHETKLARFEEAFRALGAEPEFSTRAA